MPMHHSLFSQVRSGVGPGFWSASTPAVYAWVGTELSVSDRSGEDRFSDDVFVSRHREMPVALPSTNGDWVIPKYSVPPAASTKFAGCEITGCSENARPPTTSDRTFWNTTSVGCARPATRSALENAYSCAPWNSPVKKSNSLVETYSPLASNPSCG